MIFAGAWGTIFAMADDSGERRSSGDEQAGPLAWLSKRAGLIILVVIGAIVAARLMASWIKWLLVAVVATAVLYLWKSLRKSRSDSDPGRE